MPWMVRYVVGRLVVRLVVTRRRWPAHDRRRNHELEVSLAVQLRPQ